MPNDIHIAHCDGHQESHSSVDIKKCSQSHSPERKRHHKHSKEDNKDSSKKHKESRKKTKKEKKNKKDKKRKKGKKTRSAIESLTNDKDSKGDNKSLSTSKVINEPLVKEPSNQPVKFNRQNSPSSSHLQAVVGGFGTFGPPPRPSTATSGSAERVEKAGTTVDTRKISHHRLRPRSRSRSRSRDRRHRRERKESDRKRRRSGSRSRSSDDGSEVSVCLRSGGSGRLLIDRKRLRLKALESTVMRLTERDPRKLADLPCFKTLGVTVSEMESICRRLPAQDRSTDTVASTTSSDVRANQQHQRRRQDDSSTVSVRHPFQLRPSLETKSIASSASRFGASSTSAVASQRKELLAAFPVSRGDFHSQVVDQQPEPPAVDTSASARAEAFITSFAASATSLTATATLEDNSSNSACSPHQGATYASSISMPQPAAPPVGDWASIVQAQAYRQPEAPSMMLQPQQRPNSPQAWVTKHQFLKAQPITGGIGHQLLEKMGWRSGQGLGKRNEGPTEPLAIDFKADRKGLASLEDKLSNQQLSKKAKKAIAEALSRKAGSKTRSPQIGPQQVVQRKLVGAPEQLHQLLQPVNGKHPISMLMEFARQRKWPDPQFRLVEESGPQHERCFLICVKVCGTEYQPPWPSRNKKDAKTAAASLALQHLGLAPTV